MQTIDTADIRDKHVLVRADFDVPIFDRGIISDDARITQNLPTIKSLVQMKNVVIVLAKLGRPQGKDLSLSLKPIIDVLPRYMPDYSVTYIADHSGLRKADFVYKPRHFYVLENLRFYAGEKILDPIYVQQLASLGDVYVNDCFSMSHRNEASITELPKLLPSYAGQALAKEVEMLSRLVDSPTKPYVVVMGGGKLETKVALLEGLIGKADSILVGGVLANTFLKASGHNVGNSLYQEEYVIKAQNILEQVKTSKTAILLPVDVEVGLQENSVASTTYGVDTIPVSEKILDIGVKTQHIFAERIKEAKTIVWNGPMGYIENPHFLSGTRAMLQAISKNISAFSIIGGGDTVAAIHGQPARETIDYISTAGGAMLAFLEKRTLVGIEALLQSRKD